MIYKEIQPSEILSKFIKCFWILECNEKKSEFTRERILPDGCMELIFHYGDSFELHVNDYSEIQQRSFVYGQITRFIEISPTGKVGIIAVRFFPHGALPFLHIPINEITDNTVGVPYIFGAAGRELEEKIITAANNLQRIDIIQKFLVDRLKKYLQHDSVIEECLIRIVKSKGNVSVESLSESLNINSRQLERKFTSGIGMSPKVFSRIVRFQNIFKLLQTKRINSLTELAFENGYYDQAHFIKDFKLFSGISPSVYFNEEHSLSDYFTYGK